MLTQAEKAFFVQEQALHEAKYLAGTNPQQQSGFGRDARDWERFRRAVVAPVDRDGSFLDIGCANGLLMESAVAWAREGGYRVEPSGLEISEKLAALARRRLPQWRDRIFVGNALFWEPPAPPPRLGICDEQPFSAAPDFTPLCSVSGHASFGAVTPSPSIERKA